MNKYAPRMVNFQNHKKQYRLSDYLQAERRYLGRMAVVSFLALLAVAYGFIGSTEYAIRAMSLGGL